jgi:hypothetical protein
VLFVCRVLEVGQLDGVSSHGILALRKLKSLEEFLFGLKNGHDEFMPGLLMLKQCLDLLPHLHAIGYNPKPRFFLSQPMNFSMGAAMYKIKEPCTLQLRRLSISSIENIPDQVSLPELQAFFQSQPLYEVHSLFAGGVPKLSELYLHETDEDTLLLVLGHVGRQLQALRFCVFDGMGQLFDDKVRLDRVLDACPNLSVLDANTSLSPRSVSQLRPDTLQHLQTLQMYFSYSDYMQEGLMLQFLRMAPQLKSIDLSSVMLLNEDLKAWAELAKEGACMQHLQKVYMYLDTRHFTEQEGKRLLDEVLVTCSIHCPKLQKFDADY